MSVYLIQTILQFVLQLELEEQQKMCFIQWETALFNSSPPAA